VKGQTFTLEFTMADVISDRTELSMGVLGDGPSDMMMVML
jgi:hypothetical protein